jgi:hypothetical protein
MRKISLIGIAAIIVFAVVAAWASSSHSAIKARSRPQIDPFSLMANAKNLPSQESLDSKMWPDNAVVHY